MSTEKQTNPTGGHDAGNTQLADPDCIECGSTMVRLQMDGEYVLAKCLNCKYQMWWS